MRQSRYWIQFWWTMIFIGKAYFVMIRELWGLKMEVWVLTSWRLSGVGNKTETRIGEKLQIGVKLGVGGLRHRNIIELSCDSWWEFWKSFRWKFKARDNPSIVFFWNSIRLGSLRVRGKSRMYVKLLNSLALSAKIGFGVADSLPRLGSGPAGWNWPKLEGQGWIHD